MLPSLPSMSKKRCGHILRHFAELMGYRKSRTDINPHREATLLDPLSAFAVITTLLWRPERSPTIYSAPNFPIVLHQALSIAYILCLICKKSLAIAHSFRLKLLQLEGVLNSTPLYALNNKASHLSHGESLCPTHALPESIVHSRSRMATSRTLGLGRRCSEYDILTLPPFLLNMNIVNLWNE
jgi:hypothetical protein